MGVPLMRLTLSLSSAFPGIPAPPYTAEVSPFNQSGLPFDFPLGVELICLLTVRNHIFTFVRTTKCWNTLWSLVAQS
jgi:hypothetical protein